MTVERLVDVAAIEGSVRVILGSELGEVLGRTN